MMPECREPGVLLSHVMRKFERSRPPTVADPGVGRLAATHVRFDLSQIAGRIDWDAAPNKLREGDLSTIDPAVATLIRAAAVRPDVVAVAMRFKVSPVQLILALLARAYAGSNRSAARLARVILGSRLSPEIEALCAQLGLGTGQEADGHKP